MSQASGERVREFCITVGYSGYAPFASGSWGSLAALVPAVGVIALSTLAGSRMLLELLLVVGIVLSCVGSVRWGRWAIDKYGRKDPKPFVLDEFAGQWVALLLMPVALEAPWLSVAAVLATQLFWFRLFDVLKPPPARQLEALRDGWGVLLDDLFAGLYANIAGQLIWRLTPLAGTLGLSGLAGQGG